MTRLRPHAVRLVLVALPGAGQPGLPLTYGTSVITRSAAGAGVLRHAGLSDGADVAVRRSNVTVNQDTVNSDDTG